MAKLVLRIVLARIATPEERRSDPGVGPAGTLAEAVFEYGIGDEAQARFVYGMLITRDCAADRVEVWPN